MTCILEPGNKRLPETLEIGAVAIQLSIGLAQPPKMRAQSPLTAAPMRFEAVSVKFPADQNTLKTRPRRTVGRFRWKTQFMFLLGYAYHMDWRRISEKPSPGAVSLDSIYRRGHYRTGCYRRSGAPDARVPPSNSNSVMASAPGFSRPCGIPPAAPV
jgi:hypothetical protein